MKLWKIFVDLDEDNSGALSFNEFKKAASKLDFGADKKDIKKCFKKVDKDKSGFVNSFSFVCTPLFVVKMHV